MCRMFAYSGDSIGELEELIEALMESAEKDPIGERRHGDGWGYVIAQDGAEVIYRRSAGKIWEEGVGELPMLEGHFLAIFHARLSSDKRLRGEERFSHPFREETADGDVIYLAHNGTVNKYAVGSLIGLGNEDVKEKVDSQVALKYLAKKGIGHADDLKRYVGRDSALDLLILEDRKGGRHELSYMNYFTGDEEYYRLYLKRFKSRGIAVLSSTLRLKGIETDEKAEVGGLCLIASSQKPTGD